jgi:hypothetical protein
MVDHVVDSSLPVQIDETHAVPAPGPELMMMLVCMHGTKDMWNKLYQVADVAALFENNPDADWKRLPGMAGEWGQESAVLLGAAVAKALLSVALPDEIQAELSGNRKVPRLAETVCNEMRSGTSMDTGHVRHMVFQYQSLDRVSDRLRWWRRMLFVPSDRDMEWVRLPRQLYFLHGVLRPLRLILGTSAASRRLQERRELTTRGTKGTKRREKRGI